MEVHVCLVERSMEVHVCLVERSIEWTFINIDFIVFVRVISL